MCFFSLFKKLQALNSRTQASNWSPCFSLSNSKTLNLSQKTLNFWCVASTTCSVQINNPIITLVTLSVCLEPIITLVTLSACWEPFQGLLAMILPKIGRIRHYYFFYRREPIFYFWPFLAHENRCELETHQGHDAPASELGWVTTESVPAPR